MPLPSGYADTGITATLTMTCDISLRAQVFRVLQPWARFDGVGLWFTTQASSGASDLGCVGLSSGTGLAGFSYSSVDLVLIDSPTIFGPPTYTVLASAAGACTDPGWIGPIALEKSIGPLRLGVTIQNDVMRYVWFTDSNTVQLHKVASVTKRTVTFSDPPALSTFSWSVGPQVVSASGTVTGQGALTQISRVTASQINPGDNGVSTYSHVRFSNFAANNGSGSAAVSLGEATEYNAMVTPTSQYELVGGPLWGVPFEYRGDIDCDDTSGSAVAAGATWEGARVCPSNFVVTKPLVVPSASTVPTNYTVSLGGHSVAQAALTEAWMGTQDVHPYAEDAAFRFEGQAPRTPSNASPTDYSAGSIDIDPSISVLQSANAWAITLGTGAVGGTSTVPVFTITVAPASVERDLSVAWRRWNNAADGDFESDDAYRATKHDFFASGSGDDRWGASLYSFIDADITVPAGDDSQLAFAITWAYPTTAGTPGNVDTIEVTYSDASLLWPAGARNTRRIDLMFPVELQSRPFYGERIDKIRIIGLKAGVTTVHALNLVTDEDAYITLSGRSELLTDATTRHTGIVIAQDGAAPSLLFGGDQNIVPTSDADLDGFTDARGDHQNGRFVENGVTNVLLGRAPGMRSSTMSDSLAELNRIEGITASYSDTAIDAALTDADGNELGLDTLGNPSPVPRVSTWFKPTLPHDRIAAGTPYDVRAQFVVSGIVIPCGLAASQMRVFQRNHLGQVLEGLATDADYNRHGAGVTVEARGYTGGAPGSGDTVLGSEDTDASGFVSIPVRTGRISGSDYSAYLAEG